MEIAKWMSISGLAAAELWVAIPAGFAMKAHPIAIGVAAAAGAVLGVVLVVLLGERLRNWRLTRSRKDAKNSGPKTASTRRQTITRIWNRYGIVGLGLLAPLITGAPLGAALGVGLGAPTGKLIAWMSIGVILWSAILTVVCAFGWAGINMLR